MIVSRISAVLVLVALSAPALADVAFPVSSAYSTNVSGWTVGSGTVPNDYTSVNGGYLGVLLNRVNFPTNTTFTLTLNFTGTPPAGDPTVILHDVQVSTVGTSSYTLDAIQWSYGSGANTATYDFADVTLSTVNGLNIAGSGSQGSYTTTGGFNFNSIDTLLITFTYISGDTNGPNTFVMDAVSNPEPGTMALFGLGAMGLGGFAWRRRRAKASAAAQSK